MRLQRLQLALLFTLAVTALLTAGVSAQATATPGAGEAIPASECTTPPRPITFFGDLVQTPVSDAEKNYADPTAMPQGTPPDAQTTAEITNAVRQIVACSNSGDVLRALALFDDAYLRRTLDPEHKIDVENANKLVEENLATPVDPTPDQLIVLIDIRDMVQLPDGRVAVVVESDGGVDNPKGTDVDLFIFVKTESGWIVDEAVKNIDDVVAGA